MPYNDEVGNASNGVPSPLLRSALATECGKKTGEDHDDIGDEGQNNVTTAEASEKGKIEEKERSGHGPVHVTCPVDYSSYQHSSNVPRHLHPTLAVNILGSVGNVVVGLALLDVVVSCLELDHCFK